ncbi:MAG: tellurite resistance TerB family protein [Phycisphaeraceae bacterium]
MGLFDKILGVDRSQPFGPHEGFAGILLGASACDGHIADEEVQSLFTNLGRMKMYQRYSQAQWSQLMNRLLGVLKRKGVDELLTEAVKAVPAELRETVFANAVDIVLADGVVEDDEKEFIDKLQMQLDIGNDEAMNIVQVMVVKNKG